MFARSLTNSIECNLKRGAGAVLIALTMLIGTGSEDVAKTLQQGSNLILKGWNAERFEISLARIQQAFSNDFHRFGKKFFLPNCSL
jgi:hypothetical protein